MNTLRRVSSAAVVVLLFMAPVFARPLARAGEVTKHEEAAEDKAQPHPHAKAGTTPCEAAQGSSSS